MRPSARAADELRPVRFTRQFTRHAEGSVLVEFGDTRVLCTASASERVPGWLRNTGRGWVTAEYGMLPRATGERMAREAARGRQGGRTLEIQRLIGRSLRAVVDLEALGERSIVLDCDVLQADGGTRTAAITRRLRGAGGLHHDPGATRQAASATSGRTARRCMARSRPCRWASSPASRCWTWTTPRTARRRPT